MFSTSKPYVVPILSGTEKRCKVRFPSDAEWCERARRQRAIRRFLGRGKSESEAVDSGAADLELFERIRLDKETGEAFDPAEAGAVLLKLERASVEDCEREGDVFRVALRVPGSTTLHVVRMPTRREMDRHEAASVKITGARRAQEIRGFLEPSGDLYDAIRSDTQGYETNVPIIHKSAVIAAVLGQMSDEEEEALPEE